MKMTDKHGQVYYGPKTVKQAEELIELARMDQHEDEEDPAIAIVENLKKHGYKGVAARIRTIYL